MHAIVRAAADGKMPDWATANPTRHEHMRRVADLMGAWADAAGLRADDRTRWRAAGFLHDAHKDAEPDELRPLLDPWLAGWPDKLLHGPAAAARLREEGVDDEALLRAVAWHTLGHPELDALGRALYLADYLEPGRERESERFAELRDRAARDTPGVLREVAAERITRTLHDGQPLLAETVDFWNELTLG